MQASSNDNLSGFPQHSNRFGNCLPACGQKIRKAALVAPVKSHCARRACNDQPHAAARRQHGPTAGTVAAALFRSDPGADGSRASQRESDRRASTSAGRELKNFHLQKRSIPALFRQILIFLWTFQKSLPKYRSSSLRECLHTSCTHHIPFTSAGAFGQDDRVRPQSADGVCSPSKTITEMPNLGTPVPVPDFY